MKQHLINTDSTVGDALQQLNSLSGANMTLVAVDKEMRPEGTLTDGDIRRALLAGVTLAMPVHRAMNRNFVSVKESEIASDSFTRLRAAGIRLLPVTSADGKLAELVDLDRCRGRLPLSALLMAGGKGERLRPETLSVPKPLLPLHGKAVIDYNIDLLRSYGIGDITVATRYLSEKIIAHFEGTGVKCVVEKKPLGTIGALSLIGGMPFNDILVMNSDLLTDAPIDEMLRHHSTTASAVTVAAIPYTVSVPYAILDTDGNQVTALQEKPTYSYYANAGIYILSREAVALVDRDEPVDATDLIALAIARGLRVTYFPLSGTWIDIGTPTDFRHAEELLESLGSDRLRQS